MDEEDEDNFSILSVQLTSFAWKDPPNSLDMGEGLFLCTDRSTWRKGRKSDTKNSRVRMIGAGKRGEEYRYLPRLCRYS